MENAIRIILTFRADDDQILKYKGQENFHVAKTGDIYITVVKVLKVSKTYIDYEELEQEFLENCKREETFINQLKHLEGEFVLEIVPEFKRKDKPALIFDRNLIEFLGGLGKKFKNIDIDMYIW